MDVNLPIDKLKVGMKVAESIKSPYGTVLINGGTTLNERLIKKLDEINIDSISVKFGKDLFHDDFEESVLEEKKYLNNNKQEKKKSTQERFMENEINFNYKKLDKIYNTLLNKIKQNYWSVKINNKLDIDDVKFVYNKVKEISSESDIICMISNSIGINDEYLFTHPLNISFLSLLFSKWLGLNKIETKELIYTALLHDIGVYKVPSKIINKKGILNAKEYNQMKKHCVYGYEFLKKSMVSVEIAINVLFHHERLDGSGYPLGLTKESIPFNSKILAILDTFNAMTSKKSYRDRSDPFTVFKVLKKNSNLYDKELSNIFVNNISKLYVNARLELSDNNRGYIVGISSDSLFPKIKVAEEIIDMSTSNLAINKIYF